MSFKDLHLDKYKQSLSSIKTHIPPSTLKCSIHDFSDITHCRFIKNCRPILYCSKCIASAEPEAELMDINMFKDSFLATAQDYLKKKAEIAVNAAIENCENIFLYEFSQKQFKKPDEWMEFNGSLLDLVQGIESSGRYNYHEKHFDFKLNVPRVALPTKMNSNSIKQVMLACQGIQTYSRSYSGDRYVDGTTNFSNFPENVFQYTSHIQIEKIKSFNVVLLMNQEGQIILFDQKKFEVKFLYEDYTRTTKFRSEYDNDENRNVNRYHQFNENGPTNLISDDGFVYSDDFLTTEEISQATTNNQRYFTRTYRPKSDICVPFSFALIGSGNELKLLHYSRQFRVLDVLQISDELTKIASIQLTGYSAIKSLGPKSFLAFTHSGKIQYCEFKSDNNSIDFKHSITVAQIFKLQVCSHNKLIFIMQSEAVDVYKVDSSKIKKITSIKENNITDFNFDSEQNLIYISAKYCTFVLKLNKNCFRQINTCSVYKGTPLCLALNGFFVKNDMNYRSDSILSWRSYGKKLIKDLAIYPDMEMITKINKNYTDPDEYFKELKNFKILGIENKKITIAVDFCDIKSETTEDTTSDRYKGLHIDEILWKEFIIMQIDFASDEKKGPQKTKRFETSSHYDKDSSSSSGIPIQDEDAPREKSAKSQENQIHIEKEKEDEEIKSQEDNTSKKVKMNESVVQVPADIAYKSIEIKFDTLKFVDAFGIDFYYEPLCPEDLRVVDDLSPDEFFDEEDSQVMMKDGKTLYSHEFYSVENPHYKKFYLIQAIENQAEPKKYWIWHRWGKLESAWDTLKEAFDDKEKALVQFREYIEGKKNKKNVHYSEEFVVPKGLKSHFAMMINTLLHQNS